jgi:hypothetical protein
MASLESVNQRLPYRQLAHQIIQEISSSIDSVDDERAKQISKLLCAFYQYVTYQGTLPPPEENDDNSMYVITMGVLMNHFLKNESPSLPREEFKDGQ